MSSWGSDVMMLGHVGVGSNAVPAHAVRQIGLGQTPSAAPPVDWAFLLGSYTGAFAGGAGVGYIVGRKGAAAIAGGMAASGIWGLGETIAHARDKNPMLSLAFLALGAGSLFLAWKRTGRR